MFPRTPPVPPVVAPRLVASSAALVLALGGCGENETPTPARGQYEAGVPSPLACTPNLDGRIEASELTPTLDLPVTYLVNPQGKERTVDLVGTTNAKGQLEWHFGADYEDDQVAQVQATKLEGKWYAPSFAAFPGAFTSPLDLGGRTEGVYTHDTTELRLHGIASASEAPPEGKTLYVYDRPIAIYRFPLTPGASWTTTATVTNGTLRGLPFASKDTYEMKVDAAGTLTLPDLVLTQALRVRTQVSIVPSAGQTTTQRQTGFVFECLGEVARATSKPNEPEENFTAASELRRLGLAP